eukprot:1680589-Amphidinium_carterae.1
MDFLLPIACKDGECGTISVWCFARQVLRGQYQRMCIVSGREGSGGADCRLLQCIVVGRIPPHYSHDLSEARC